MVLTDPRGLALSITCPLYHYPSSITRPVTKKSKDSLITNNSDFKLYPNISNKQGCRGASEYQRYRGVWYCLIKTIRICRFQMWFNTYSPLRFFHLSKTHGMYPRPHTTQNLFIIQPVTRFSSEQISWCDHLLMET